MGETFYVTTPIYYVNDIPHIGTAYTTVAADVIARYQRLKGRDVFFLTGVDEHGQKVAQAAAERGESPQSWIDQIVPRFTDTWELLDISNDDFIRTTQNRHTKVAQDFMEKLKSSDDIYLSSYEGWYCIHDESFLLSSQLKDQCCPDCNRPVEWVKEENYFFRLSKYADRVLSHIEENPEFVQPESRRNEVVSFIRGGLDDQSISRTSFSWGIPLPFDMNHVMYVWFDALLNYITAAGYGDAEERFARVWPANWHLVGKEILRFHAVIWPAMLMAAELPLPDHVFAHGWLTVEGEKMSKSLGNAITPQEVVDAFGVDAYRYYFMREFSFGVDGNFSWRTLLTRYNSDLANDLGNLESRVMTMTGKYRGGIVPEPGDDGEEDERLRRAGEAIFGHVVEKLEKLAFNDALAEIWEFIHAVNRYVDVSAPWALAKQGLERQLDNVLFNSLESLRVIALLIAPFMPRAAEKMWERLGYTSSLWEERLPGALGWGLLPVANKTTRAEGLFPRKLEEKE